MPEFTIDGYTDLDTLVQVMIDDGCQIIHDAGKPLAAAVVSKPLEGAKSETELWAICHGIVQAADADERI